MKKSYKIYIIVWAILLAVFNIICFVTPSEIAGMTKFDGAFWTGYIFITLAFIVQLVCAYFAFKADSAKKFFYNVPLITISYTGLILMLVAGALVMAIPNLPVWIGILVCLLILAFSAVSVLKAGAAAELVEKTDEKINTQTFFIKTLTADASGLMARAQTKIAAEQTKKVYEAIRYSDPMSNEALSGTESQITILFSEFSDAVTAGNDTAVQQTAKNLLILLQDRNNKYKLLK